MKPWLIMHTEEFHRVTRAKGFSERNFIAIYDSSELPITKYLDPISNDELISPKFFNCISCLTRSHFEVAGIACSIQKGGSACGFYAVAFATSLAICEDPTLLGYNQSQMAEHLQNVSD